MLLHLQPHLVFLTVLVLKERGLSIGCLNDYQSLPSSSPSSLPFLLARQNLLQCSLLIFQFLVLILQVLQRGSFVEILNQVLGLVFVRCLEVGHHLLAQLSHRTALHLCLHALIIVYISLYLVGQTGVQFS